MLILTRAGSQAEQSAAPQTQQFAVFLKTRQFSELPTTRISHTQPLSRTCGPWFECLVTYRRTYPQVAWIQADPKNMVRCAVLAGNAVSTQSYPPSPRHALAFGRELDNLTSPSFFPYISYIHSPILYSPHSSPNNNINTTHYRQHDKKSSGQRKYHSLRRSREPPDRPYQHFLPPRKNHSTLNTHPKNKPRNSSCSQEEATAEPAGLDTQHETQPKHEGTAEHYLMLAKRADQTHRRQAHHFPSRRLQTLCGCYVMPHQQKHSTDKPSGPGKTRPDHNQLTTAL